MYPFWIKIVNKTVVRETQLEVRLTWGSSSEWGKLSNYLAITKSEDISDSPGLVSESLPRTLTPHEDVQI